MKKLWILMLALVLLLAGCDPNGKKEETGDDGLGKETTASDTCEDGLNDDGEDNEMVPKKPVIYFYPAEDTVCSVRVDINGRLTCTYPEHGDAGWQNFVAKPDGTLVFPDGSAYYCLYWEGIAKFEPDFSRGFCVKGSDTATFLREVLPKLGLNYREANEFIIYWLPLMQENSYNLISFQADAYTNSAPLEITPTPDSLLRVFIAWRALDEPVEVAPQSFDGFVRNGFTVVEWGGCEVK